MKKIFHQLWQHTSKKHFTLRKISVRYSFFVINTSTPKGTSVSNNKGSEDDLEFLNKELPPLPPHRERKSKPEEDISKTFYEDG